MNDQTEEINEPAKPITLIEAKFLFLAKVLSDPDSRNKRRPRITAFDGSVLAMLVKNYNKDRGYSFIGCRGIADAINATAQGVARSIRKLKELGFIIEVSGGHTNRAQRLAPDFESTVNGYSVSNTVNGIAVDATVNGIGVVVPETAIAFTDTLNKRSDTKFKRTYQGAGASRPSRAKARPGAASSPDPKKIMALLEDDGDSHG
jgi:hypothetical protein